MEHVACNVCGASSPVPFLRRADRFGGELFEYSVCSQCGLIFLNPRPNLSELIKYYPSNYEAHYITDPKTRLEAWRLRRALDIQIAFVERFVPQRGRLLDIGCGTGSFLDRARENRWRVVGVEWVEQAAQLARDYYGLEVLIGSGERIALPGESCDLVTLWDVLEHVPDPSGTLSEGHRLLRNGGAIIFSVPNLRSFTRHLFGRTWAGWDAPRHLHLFTDNVIEQLLEMHGFRLEASACVLGEEGVFALSVEFLFGGRHFHRVIGLATALMWPYRQMAYALKRGGIITFVARKSRP